MFPKGLFGVFTAKLELPGSEGCMDYLVVIEKSKTGYAAYLPDLPGCVATGKTVEDVRQSIKEAVELHLEGMKEDGDKPLKPTTAAMLIAIDKDKVVGEKQFEPLYDIKAFSAKARITTSTARVYAHRYGIGRKMGRGWVFTDADLQALPSANP
jgi:predicted RNase H-like HicB family nuclease